MAKLGDKGYEVSLLNDLILVDASLELNKVPGYEEELKLIKKVLNDEIQLVETLTSPNVKEDEKGKLIEDIFKGNISDQMLELLKKIFIKYTDVLRVTAITVVPMEKHALEKLKSILKSKFDKDIVLSNEVDKTIIGGVLLRIGDKVIDGTLEGELAAVRKSLKRGITIGS